MLRKVSIAIFIKGLSITNETNIYIQSRATEVSTSQHQKTLSLLISHSGCNKVY